MGARGGNSKWGDWGEEQRVLMLDDGQRLIADPIAGPFRTTNEARVERDRLATTPDCYASIRIIRGATDPDCLEGARDA